MILVYSAIILIVVFGSIKLWSYIFKKCKDVDKEAKLEDVNEKMEDIEVKTEAVKKIERFEKTHEGVEDADGKIKEFLNK